MKTLTAPAIESLATKWGLPPEWDKSIVVLVSGTQLGTSGKDKAPVLAWKERGVWWFQCPLYMVNPAYEIFHELSDGELLLAKLPLPSFQLVLTEYVLNRGERDGPS